MALQRARREAAANAAKDKEEKPKPSLADSDVFGGPVNLQAARETKRRKVAAVAAGGDPFGGPL